VNLRAAVPDDAAAIADLERDMFGADAWSLALVVAELSGATGSGTLAVGDGGLVGYAVTRRSGDTVDLQRIAVRPAHRRRGVARALLRAAVGESRRAGARWMLLEVSETNRAALAFYARAGFGEINRRRRYYRDGSDALVLRLPLDGADPDTERMGT
jgi:ribosomal-protein-alanine N-acetyltransferase